ncbi:hypothetical protein CFIO01_02308 [Colletotrichum fioriniae PJ7]|uniref:Uncharacterized protein n=1 Tax=Colletotrichum fioriniae PJ7 TaxID=1445577 RepID=A0A010S655_9PEZI|nr:hypothetical protein CFIO01_02308 [Colletotrichum fioriniae PJ7]
MASLLPGPSLTPFDSAPTQKVNGTCGRERGFALRVSEHADMPGVPSGATILRPLGRAHRTTQCRKRGALVKGASLDERVAAGSEMSGNYPASMNLTKRSRETCCETPGNCKA